MIIDGKKIAAEILEQVKAGVSKLPFQPVFCDVLVGSDGPSAQYVRMKARTAEKVGIKFRNADYPASITTQDLIAEIKKINREQNLCGLIVQLPLPASLDKQAVLDAIEPKIDVDCTGSANMELFYSGNGILQFPTAAAVLAILDSLDLNLMEKQFLVLGQGQLVGKPVTFLLKKRGLKVEVADKYTANQQQLMLAADVIITATGQAGLVTGEKIEPGAIVIDAGTSESNGGVVGDVDFESVSKTAAFLSPTPGGVGPVTVAMLLKNVVAVAKARHEVINS